MSEIIRSDKQYVEVEEFADYELTQCIAYEMAIRDYYYRESADEAVAFYNENKESIDRYLQAKYEQHNLDQGFNKESYDRYLQADDMVTEEDRENYYVLYDLIVRVGMVRYTEATSKDCRDGIFDIRYQYIDNRLGDMFWDIVKMFRMEYDYDIRHLDKGEGKLIFNDNTGETSLTHHYDGNGYFIDKTISTYQGNHGCGEEDINSIAQYKDFFEEGGYDFCYSQITIEENFKRPLVRIDEHKTISPELIVNLNRPLQEIIALITHIKKDMKKNKLDKLPIELFGTELKRADNLVCNDKGEKCFDPRGILSTQQKMADMFYIYDCLKEGYTKRKIQNEVYNYYADKGLENITLDQKTLNKYQRIAIDYIDNRKYEEMLTGVSRDGLSQEFG